MAEGRKITHVKITTFTVYWNHELKNSQSQVTAGTFKKRNFFGHVTQFLI